MHFKMTFILSASTVEKWICHNKKEFLDNTPVK
jgi:hypothetical protein